jgi:predicted GIY-YIG superfamily endonuclease
MYFVYFLRSESDPDKVYIGFTENLVRRLREHNEGEEGGAHTRKYRPWGLEAFVLADTRQTARAAEVYFKNTSGKEKFQRFAAANPNHPNPIAGFFESQDVGRKFGRARFEVANNRVMLVSECD